MTAADIAETAPVAEPADRPRPAVPDRGKRMVDLAAGDCRFPVGPAVGRGRRFCGHPARPGSPYCEIHHAIAYLAPPDEAHDQGADDQANDAAKEARR